MEIYRHYLNKSLLRMLLCAALVLTGCKEQIIHNLSESEANRLLTRLDEAKIESEKVKQADGKWALAVEKGQVVVAIKFLSDARMLRAESVAISESGSVLSSREEQRFRYERALSKEIESTLSSIDGVLESRVHLNMAPLDPLLGNVLPNSKGTASVLVVALQQFTLGKDEISALVSGASGIEIAGISVLINRTMSSPTEKDNKEIKNVEQDIGTRITVPQNQIMLDRGIATKMAAFLIVLGAGLLSYLYISKRRNDVVESTL